MYTRISLRKFHVLLYRFNSFIQSDDLFLKKMECSSLASMTSKGCCTRPMDAVDPRLQLNLARGLERNTHTFIYIILTILWVCCRQTTLSMEKRISRRLGFHNNESRGETTFCCCRLSNLIDFKKLYLEMLSLSLLKDPFAFQSSGNSRVWL